MREDLQAAARHLGLTQRLRFRHHLQQTGSLLGAAETVQAIGCGWRRGHRTIVVVTSSRLLLSHRTDRRSHLTQAAISFRAISELSVHPSPPNGARFQLTLRLHAEEFSVTTNSAAVETALRARQP